jgi:dihydroneopterin aldolase
MNQTLYIEDIQLHAYHGCLEEEGIIGGKYRVDIKVKQIWNCRPLMMICTKPLIMWWSTI